MDSGALKLIFIVELNLLLAGSSHSVYPFRLRYHDERDRRVSLNSPECSTNFSKWEILEGHYSASKLEIINYESQSFMGLSEQQLFGFLYSA